MLDGYPAHCDACGRGIVTQEHAVEHALTCKDQPRCKRCGGVILPGCGKGGECWVCADGGDIPIKKKGGVGGGHEYDPDKVGFGR